MSNSIVLFTGTMTDSVRNTIEEYGPERLEPGDVIVANDPYRTGTHVNDLLFCRPVFHAGRIVAFVNLKAHQLDMGGSVPGGFCHEAQRLRERARALAARAVQRRQPVRETWSLIFDNVRFGEILFYPTCSTICADLELGERLLQTVDRRHGAAALHGAMRYVCDAAAERMTAALERCPTASGTARPWSTATASTTRGVPRARDHPKRGGRVEVDFSGTSRQARTCINATSLDAKTTVGIALKYLLDPTGRSPRGCPPGRHRAPRGDDLQRAAARRRGVRLLASRPRRCCWRCSARSPRRSARLRSPATWARRHPQRERPRADGTPWIAVGVTAARSAPSARRAPATPTASASSTRPTGSTRRSRPPRPTRRS